MLTYIIIFSILLFFVIIETFYNRQISNEKRILISIFIILLFFVSIRGIGFDYNNYENYYLEIKKNINSIQVEPLFKLLCLVCPTYQYLIFVISSIGLYYLYKICWLFSPYKFLPLFIYYCVNLLPGLMGQMRQAVVILIILYAFLKYREQKKRFLITIIICSLFHSSALIALLYFLPLNKKYNISIYIILFLGSLLITNGLLIFFGSSIDILTQYGGGVIGSRLDTYYRNETLNGISLGFNTAILNRLIIFIPALYLYKLNKGIPILYINFYFLSILLYISFGFIPQIGGRASIYFAMLEILLIPLIIKSIKSNLRYLYIFLYIILTSYRFITLFSNPQIEIDYIPYKTFF